VPHLQFGFLQDPQQGRGTSAFGTDGPAGET